MDEYATVVDIVTEIIEEESPLFLNLNDLQIEANRLLGLSAAETLKCAQKLYEAELLTYPRTSSRYITPDMEQSVSTLVSGEGGTAPPGTGGAAPLDNNSSEPNGKKIFGPYYDEAVRRHEENPDYYPDPDVCTITQGEELYEMRSQYNSMAARGQLKRGHHIQGLAFGGKNIQSNITQTGESTIRRSELPEDLQKEYYEKGYTSRPNYKHAKIVEDPNGKISKNGKTYSFGLNRNHTEVTNFQKRIIRWQEKVGLRKKRKKEKKNVGQFLV